MTTKEITMVAIDIAKIYNHALIEFPDGNRKKLKFKNDINGFKQLKREVEKQDYSILNLQETFTDPLGIFLSSKVTKSNKSTQLYLLVKEML
jgi:hypothetical protein